MVCEFYLRESCVRLHVQLNWAADIYHMATVKKGALRTIYAAGRGKVTSPHEPLLFYHRAYAGIYHQHR